MKNLGFSKFPKGLLAGGSMLLSFILLIDLHGSPSFSSKKPLHEICQQPVSQQNKLSRAQIAKLLTIPEGNKKQKVQEILKEPYCQLSDLQVRAGATAERSAYLLEFDPQVRLIVLYEGDQYVGYRFDIH